MTVDELIHYARYVEPKGNITVDDVRRMKEILQECAVHDNSYYQIIIPREKQWNDGYYQSFPMFPVELTYFDGRKERKVFQETYFWYEEDGFQKSFEKAIQRRTSNIEDLYKQQFTDQFSEIIGEN